MSIYNIVERCVQLGSIWGATAVSKPAAVIAEVMKRSEISVSVRDSLLTTATLHGERGLGEV